MQEAGTRQQELAQTANQLTQELQQLRTMTSQEVEGLKQDIRDAMTKQSQDLEAIKQTLGGPIEGWAARVNSEMQGLRADANQVQSAVSQMQSQLSGGPTGLFSHGDKRGILESKAWAGLKILDPDKMHFR